MDKNVGICPVCGGELVVDKVTDFEHCGSDCVAWVTGFCDDCGRKFKWEDVFELSFSRSIKEIDA